MTISLLPKIILESVTQITPPFLEQRGIRLLMLDFDNTLVPYTASAPSTEIAQWITMMKNSPIQLCVVSNSKRERVRIFCEENGLPCITHAKKPFSRGIEACMTKYHLPPGACALVGDQIYTDTLGANAAGLTSILVRPIHLHNIWLKLRHVAELPFIILAKNRRIKP